MNNVWYSKEEVVSRLEMRIDENLIKKFELSLSKWSGRLIVCFGSASQAAKRYVVVGY